ncbi:MAG: hypothetical protein KAJ49_00295 [Arcobacteraceae bacterium]|nr:hypothetical protein [Arcobacteraceae bacterium]
MKRQYIRGNTIIKQFFEYSNFNGICVFDEKSIYISKYFDDKSDYAKILEVSTLLIHKSYISFLSSMYYYNLSDQLPKRLFLSVVSTF